ncbi:MAG: hypothetical protein ACREJC_02365, partial [Tepidisphaeraceae bacterium]
SIKAPDRLKYDAPLGAITPDVLAAMKAYKPVILAMLRADWYAAAAALLDGIPDPDTRAELRFRFEERAAICQYDGGLIRKEAERIAFEEIQRAMMECAT